ncbi:MAG: hypothetical protein HS116_26775 [Planctomycetes bacterium]|nr:hypothetical protein [Planctomycetota bacterium]
MKETLTLVVLLAIAAAGVGIVYSLTQPDAPAAAPGAPTTPEKKEAGSCCPSTNAAAVTKSPDACCSSQAVAVKEPEASCCASATAEKKAEGCCASATATVTKEAGSACCSEAEVKACCPTLLEAKAKDAPNAEAVVQPAAEVNAK